MENYIIDALNPPTITCVVAQKGTIVYTASGLGVKPLLTLYRENPELLAGASVADTIVGKAAAVLLVLAKATCVHGVTMSRAAQEYLDLYGIAHSCEQEVPLILNRSGDGSCPLEAAVSALSDPHEAYAALIAQIEVLMQGG